MAWVYTSPRTIVFGREALEYVEQIEGERVLVITDRTMQRLGLLELLLGHLKGRQVQVFSDVEPEPSLETARRAARAAQAFSPNLIISLGGASCTDVAKSAWLFYERPELDFKDLTPSEPLGLGRKAKLVAIPTTSGPGSEASWAIVLTSPEEKRKLEFGNRDLVPLVTILDPALPLRAPAQLLASTGSDGVAEGIEAYISKWTNEFTKALAARGLELLFRYLPLACSDRKDLQAQEKVHIASALLGLAFSNSQVGLIHAMGHALGGLYKIQHGRTLTPVFKQALQYTLPEAREDLAELAYHLRIAGDSEEARAKGLIGEAVLLFKRLGMPLSLQELGIPRAAFERDLPELVTRAQESTGLFVSPRVPDERELARLFLYAYEGRDVDF
ncbi:MAG: NAD-dependent alcohol dehydrogenase [Nitrososphaerota archaeon]